MEVRIRFGGTDCTGRIFFPKYFELFDDATFEFFREKGIFFDSLGHILLNDEITEEILVIGECGCRFLSPTFFDDILEVKPEIKELTGKKIIFNVTCYNKTQGKICAEGNITFIYFNAQIKKTAKIPDEIAKRLNRLTI
jgi:YbgC/YbaW family acyl-CoA thioester hydrolase